MAELVLDLCYESKTEIPSSKTENEEPDSSCSVQDYDFYKYIEKMIARPFSYNYFYETTFVDDDDDGAIGDEYKRFLYFIDKCEEPVKSQLTFLCYPVFVHFQLLVLVRNSVGAKNAENFYEDFVLLFQNAEGYNDTLTELGTLKTIDDVMNHNYFKQFWKMKYACSLSYGALRSLKRFLQQKKSKILLNVLRFHFYFDDLQISPDFVSGSDIFSTYKSLTSKSDMDDVGLIWKMQMSNVYISRIVFSCNIASCSALDFNEDASQIAIAHSCPVLSVANLEKQNISEFLEQSGIDSYTTGTMERITLPETVCTVKYIPGSKNILVSSGCEIKMLNSETGSVLLTFKANHTNSIVDIDINSSATLFASASRDMTSCLWSFDKEVSVEHYVGHTDCVNTVKFHPNGNYLATGSSDCTIRLWSIENGHVVRIFADHKTEVHCIAFSLDGKLASADALGIIKIWNINNNSIISEMAFDTFELNLTRVSSLCFNFDASMLAACNYKGILKIWSTEKCRSQTPHTRLHFRNIPLVIKSNEKCWIIVFKKITNQ